MYVGIMQGALSRRKAPVAESAGGSGLGSDAWCCTTVSQFISQRNALSNLYFPSLALGEVG
jgi:hypothetical protein